MRKAAVAQVTPQSPGHNTESHAKPKPGETRELRAGKTVARDKAAQAKHEDCIPAMVVIGMHMSGLENRLQAM